MSRMKIEMPRLLLPNVARAASLASRHPNLLRTRVATRSLDLGEGVVASLPATTGKTKRKDKKKEINLKKKGKFVYVNSGYAM